MSPSLPGEPLRLAVLGESRAAGVGAAVQEEAMAGRFGRQGWPKRPGG